MQGKMLRKITFLIVVNLISCQIACSGEKAKVNMEENTVSAGMSVEAVTAMLKKHGYKKLDEKEELINGKLIKKIAYKFKPRNDITPVHGSWWDSTYVFSFEENILSKIDWYKKDGSVLKLGVKKLYLGPE
jgi:hypothetical protein